ncbi:MULTISPECIES: PqqD family protein [Streptomyces]|uniref:PqqD family protein n=1 Tax=Streptomyces TaxID=1883 RepID=UPI00296EFA81|nr:PqqD family protein [Streptomyces californicus]MDW4898843.1 PqqD family protein [Streptomyces californicus]
MDEVTVRSDARPRRVLGTRIRRKKDDFLIGDRDRALLLEGIAAFVFAALDGRRSTLDVARLVAEEYGADEEEVLADVVEFLGGLREKGFVDW